MKITLCKARAFRLRLWVKNSISKYNLSTLRLQCCIKKCCGKLIYNATKLQIESLCDAKQWIRDLNQNVKKKTKQPKNHCCSFHYIFMGRSNATVCDYAWLISPQYGSVVFSSLDASCGDSSGWQEPHNFPFHQYAAMMWEEKLNFFYAADQSTSQSNIITNPTVKRLIHWAELLTIYYYCKNQ